MTGPVVLASLLTGLAVSGLVPAGPRTPRAGPGPRSARRPAGTLRGPRLRASVAAAAALGAWVLVGGTVGLLVAAAAGTVSWRLAGRVEEPAVRRRRELLTARLPHVVDLMAASLSVGAAPATAVERIARAVEAPMSQELAAVGARLRLGVDPVRVWAELGRHPQLGPLGRCLTRAADTGSSVAEAMHRLAEDQRRDSRAAVERRARAVGVKAAAPLGLCLLPAFVLMGIVPLVAGSVAVFLNR